MFAASPDMTNLIGRRSKLAPFYWTPSRWRLWPSRQLLCRLPLLALWTLIVIIILYKSLSEHQGKNLEAEDGTKVTTSNNEADKMTTSLYMNPLVSKNLDRADQLPSTNKMKFVDDAQQKVIKTGEGIGRIKTKNVIPSSLPTSNSNKKLQLETTTKPTTDEYSRRGKVFILIIQNEPFRVSSSSIFQNPGQQYKRSATWAHYGTSPKIVIPAHLRLLIEILDSHRIEYTIDTTRTGLPTSLLNDQSHNFSENNNQYSVIVIDSFIKYTRLNRWVRDQLDRHCRANEIGIVTYLTQDDELTHQLKINHFHQNQQQLTSSNDHKQYPAYKSTSEQSMVSQFPLTFNPFPNQKAACKNLTSDDCLVDYQLNEESSILRTLKRRPNFILDGPLTELSQSPWVAMSSNHITYEPLTWAKLRRPDQRRKRMAPMDLFDPLGRLQKVDAVNTQQSTASTIRGSTLESADQMDRQILSMFDRGLYDGIRRVIFGGDNSFWLNRMLLLDAIEHLSSGRILTPLDRYIQIDIDDIFVGERGKRMNASDVDSLIEVQNRLAQLIDGGFKFNLGFSGKYFKRGFEWENEGDQRLVDRAREFTWFCHTWAHTKAHLSNETRSIEEELRKNLHFARAHRLPIIGWPTNYYNEHNDDDDSNSYSRGNGTEKLHPPPTYAVAPHHSGVYPIHEQLYEAWRRVLNVQVTSTEEYPRLKPASGRRGFLYKSIKVLPRQTCGLYTHTVFRAKYPGGIDKLNKSIFGGELFETVLHNLVNIYMSHMSNYANDRLALGTFLALIDFVQTNTNLKLKYAPTTTDSQSEEEEESLADGRDKPTASLPVFNDSDSATRSPEDKNTDAIRLGPAKLAAHYFELYPRERRPLWTNPCGDKRHLAIWAPWKHRLYCPLAPKLLIVGPQKTGTTALYTFLKMNPLFRSSDSNSSADFEELQFFNDKHYDQGVDWYFSRFAQPEVEPTGSGEFIYFDKSATYFDDPQVPPRASSLLPEARIIILLVDPADRAYSWYQHMRAHGDRLAQSLSFEQLIGAEQIPLLSTSAAPVASGELAKLRSRCLHPGYYAQHLAGWLQFYAPRQIIIIDGLWFRHNPGPVLNKLQLLLRVEQPLDYSQLLVYDQHKGFYCQRVPLPTSGSAAEQNRSHRRDSDKCLGSSKGRKYPPMSREARAYLKRHYWAHNRELSRVLSDIGQPLPIWLEETMSSSSSGNLLH